MTNPESVIIGAALINEASLLDALETIKPHHFEDTRNRKIWEWMSQRASVGSPVDVAVVLSHFGSGEAVRLSSYMDAATGLGVSLAGACEALVKGYQRRVLLDGLQGAHRAAQGPDPIAAVPLLEATLAGVSDASTESPSEQLGPVLDATLQFLMERQEAKERGDTVYVPTGIKALDRFVDGGFASEELIVIAARPAMGKTEILMDGAKHQSLHVGPTMVFSLEMSRMQLAQRALRNAADVDIRKSIFTPDEWDRLEGAAGELAPANLEIDDTAGISIGEIRRRALRHRRKHGPLAGIWIDYLQLVSGEGQTRENVIASISRDAKKLAKELKCPVFLLAQLNRDCEKRQDKRPLMSDLRESGAVEQDADIIIMLYRDAYYNQDTTATPFDFELLVRKFRRGQGGCAVAGWANGRIYDTPEMARDAR